MLEDRNGRFVVHTLLLHGSLSERVLAELVPVPLDHVTRCLVELEDAEAVEASDDGWRVSAGAYASIRARISDSGYWVDSIQGY